MSKTQYLLFNPYTGRHISFATLEELYVAREEFLQVELEKLRPTFKILEETFYPNGDSETRPYLKDAQNRPTSDVKLTFSHKVPPLVEPHSLLKKIEVI